MRFRSPRRDRSSFTWLNLTLLHFRAVFRFAALPVKFKK